MLETPRRLCILAGYIGSVIIAVLSLVPVAARPHAGISGEYEHAVAYALVGAAFGMGYPTTGGRLLAGGALMAGAAILELLQNFVPGRSPEAIGFLASSAGAWFGLGLVVVAAAILRATVK